MPKLPHRIDIGRESDPFREPQFCDIIEGPDEIGNSWRFEHELFAPDVRESGMTFEEGGTSRFVRQTTLARTKREREVQTAS